MCKLINVYCDESCHLENDGQKSMSIGCIWTPVEELRKSTQRIKEYKRRHNLPSNFEIKWVKVSPSKISFYLDIVDYFFDNKDLHYRCVVIPDKDILRHKEHNQVHDEWYYKMYFNMLKVIIDPSNKYAIYLDIKDTHGATKVKKLHEVLCNSIFDFDNRIIKRLQIVRSHEIELLQIADLFNGAMTHFHRRLNTSVAKQAIIERLQKKSGYPLTKTTLYKESKFNILVWNPNLNDSEV